MEKFTKKPLHGFGMVAVAFTFPVQSRSAVYIYIYFFPIVFMLLAAKQSKFDNLCMWQRAYSVPPCVFLFSAHFLARFN